MTATAQKIIIIGLLVVAFLTVQDYAQAQQDLKQSRAQCYAQAGPDWCEKR